MTARGGRSHGRTDQTRTGRVTVTSESGIELLQPGPGRPARGPDWPVTESVTPGSSGWRQSVAACSLGAAGFRLRARVLVLVGKAA